MNSVFQSTIVRIFYNIATRDWFISSEFHFNKTDFLCQLLRITYLSNISLIGRVDKVTLKKFKLFDFN